jgi:hypothetical protein
VASASPHETALAPAALAARFTAQAPARLIGDRAYDSDPLDALLRQEGIEMIAPHRRNRTKPQTQDGRKLRRYRPAGRPSGCLPGCKTSVVFRLVTSGIQKTISGSSNWDASSFYSERFSDDF